MPFGVRSPLVTQAIRCHRVTVLGPQARSQALHLDRKVHGDVVARLGGDEFVIVLTHLADTLVVRDTLQRLLERISLPIALPDGAAAQVSASLGVALCPGDGDNVDILLRRADEAMYEAKGAGRNQVRFYADTP